MNKYIYLDMYRYKIELRRAFRRNSRKVGEYLYDKVLAQLAITPFKDNIVKLAGGRVTSDADRKHSVRRSVRYVVHKIEDQSIQVTIGALSKNFKTSHIGLYYEYGTGNEWTGEESVVNTEYSVDHTYRSGRDIVSRSKFINYSGVGKGKWLDLGGNVRETSSFEAGTRDAGFIAYVGDDTKAYKWFSGTIEDHKEDIDRIVLETISEVPITRFLSIMPKFTLGKD